MKTKVLYPVSICLLLICFWACNNEKKMPQEVKSAVIHLTDSCGLNIDKMKSYKIPSDTAIGDIARYEIYYDQLKATLPDEESDHLILGVNVAIEELYQLLCTVRSEPKDSLFIMNAIKFDTTSKGKDTTITDMIFVLQKHWVPNGLAELDEPTEPKSPLTFFDFTQPCPAACPSLYNLELDQ